MDAIRLALLLVTLSASPQPAQPVREGVTAYAGQGAWVDRYDFARLDDPEVAAAEMAVHGVQTVYVETASWKVPRSVDVVDPGKTEGLIDAAHANGMKVVAWYLPGLRDRRIDMRRIRAALGFTSAKGEHFDGFALDIEANIVNPVWRRNLALLRLSRSIRREVGDDYALGAIVPDQLSTSRGNVLWPSFPYAALAKTYDVFLPMAYSTFGRGRGSRAVYRYTLNNLRYVRAATGRPVHVIGGITDAMTEAEQDAVTRAARRGGAYGVSFYKYLLYDPGSWLALASFED
jgi:hypothetical protein